MLQRRADWIKLLQEVRDNMERSDGWYNWLQEVVQFKTEYGHTDVDVKDSHSKFLNRWLCRNKRLLQRNEMLPD